MAAHLDLFAAANELEGIWRELSDALPDYVSLRTAAVSDWRSVQHQLERVA